jgi:Protein of unknown function (DUF2567)
MMPAPMPGPVLTGPVPPGPVPPSPTRRAIWIQPGEVRGAGVIAAALAIVGALAGFGWSAWSATPTRGLIYSKTAIIPDQTEGFISSDGRFVVITAIIGVIAGLIVWRFRSVRGPVAVLGLAVGAVVGALLTDLVGRLVGGGTTSGAVNTVIRQLPLQVHASGLLLIEALLAVGVYVLGAAFINPDDLGRPDQSVRPGLDLQQPGGDGHAAGAPEQDDLAAQ